MAHNRVDPAYCRSIRLYLERRPTERRPNRTRFVLS